MRSRRSLLLSLCLVVAIALSSFVVQVPSGSNTDEAGVIARAAEASKAKHDHARHRDRGQDRKHQRGHKQSDRRERSGPSSWPDKGPTQGASSGKAGDRQGLDAGPTVNWHDLCTSPLSEELPASKQCTHGPDPAPPGFNVDRAVRAVSAQEANAAAQLVCEGDGASGNRVQVIYVHATNQTSRFTQFLTSFRTWAGQADQIFQQSAAETGGTRNLRFVHNASCDPVVLDVTIPPSAVNDFDLMNAELRTQGFNHTDRIYLAFVDTTTAGICGIGTIWNDDRASATLNANNFGPRYSRVDAGCWGGSTAAHELMHNIGGVQLSAPNSSGGYHCIDEIDRMCYSDDPDHPTMRIDCPDVAHESRFDCGHQDYYNTNPATGSYLATHWNPTNNQFLIVGGDAPPPPPPDHTAPAVQWTAPVGNGQTQSVTAGSVSLAASATDNVGVTRVEFYRYDDASSTWVSIGTDTTAPYESTIDAGTLAAGRTVISADAFDAAGNWSYEMIGLNRSITASPPPDNDPTHHHHKKHKRHKHGHKHKGH